MSILNHEQQHLSATINAIDAHISELNGDVSLEMMNRSDDKELYSDTVALNQKKERIEQDLNKCLQVRKSLYKTKIIVMVDAKRQKFYCSEHEYMFKPDSPYNIYKWTNPMFLHFVVLKRNDNFSAQNGDEFNLQLRRIIKIKNQRVKRCIDEYVSDESVLNEKQASDEFLDTLRSKRGENGFSNIIFSIQNEQAAIATEDFRSGLIVQGCAGSGKTMIMLHRLPIVLDNHGENISRNRISIISPSDTYKQVAQRLLGELEIKDIRIGIIEDYYRNVIIKYSSGYSDIDKQWKRVDTGTDSLIKAVYSKVLVKQIEEALNTIWDGADRLLNRAAALIDIDLNKEDDFIKNKLDNNYDVLFQKIGNLHIGWQKASNATRRLFRACHTLRDETSRLKYVSNELLERICDIVENYSLQTGEYFVFSTPKLMLEQLKPVCEALYVEYSTGGKQGSRYLGMVDTILEQIKEYDGHYNKIQCSTDTLNELEIIVSRIDSMRNNAVKYAFSMAMERLKKQEPVMKDNVKYSFSYYLYLQCIYHYAGPLKNNTDQLVVVDEAQNIAPAEYQLINDVNGKVKFNIYGDINQHLEETKGVDSWEELPACFTGYKKYDLKYNYRNTASITEYCNTQYGCDMLPTGLEGDNVRAFSSKDISLSKVIDEVLVHKEKDYRLAILSNGQKGVNKKALGKHLLEANFITEHNKELDFSKINIMSIKDAIGLEFETVIIVAKNNMTIHEGYLACTRALQQLYIYNI